MADLEDGGLLALQRDMNLNWTFLKLPCSQEKGKKTVPFKRTLDHTHSFTNGKMLSDNVCIVYFADL